MWEPLASATALSKGTQFQRVHLGEDFRVEDVRFESDPDVCRRISRKYGPIPPAPSGDTTRRPVYPDVMVVRFGNRGYYVQTRWNVGQSGEFTCFAVFLDRTLKQRTEFCG